MSLNRLCLSLVTAAALFSGIADAAEQAAEAAPSGTYMSDPAHSSVIWKISHLGLSSYTARFTRMTAELIWNAEHPEMSSVTATIDPLSVQTNFPFPERENFDKEIGTEERFLAGKPISFVSKKITVTDARHGIVNGDLKLRGETHPATLNVTFNGSMARQPAVDKAKIGFSADLIFKRADWGLAPKVKSAGEDVIVIIEAELQPAEAADHSSKEKPGQ
ncbi:YceI family protein [Rhizobium panacihumi]|uniref:YceI family protein n=1 Tax=Rhizobium panacihumi TaxID=2008450 RepID=UPI003D7A411C